MQHKRNDRHNTPWARLASVMASIVLVLSLIPIQGLAEARDEFLDLTNTASQEPQTTDGSNDPGGGTHAEIKGRNCEVPVRIRCSRPSYGQSAPSRVYAVFKEGYGSSARLPEGGRRRGTR